MKIGRKIYYDKSTGNVIVDTGEMQGSVKETTIEQDFEAYQALQGRNQSSIGVLKFKFGEYAEEFARATGLSVDVDSKIVLFDFTPTEPIKQEPNMQERINAQLLKDNAEFKLEIEEQRKLNSKLLLTLAERGVEIV